MSLKELGFNSSNNIEAAIRALTNPLLLADMWFSKPRRDLNKDAQTLLQLPHEVSIQGEENILTNGPLIIAFPHINTWRDVQMPPYWELVTLAQVVRSHRKDSIAMLAKTTRVINTSPIILKPLVHKFVDEMIQKTHDWYDIDVIEIDSTNTIGSIRKTLTYLQEGHTVCLSPEGTQTQQLKNPKRGVGALARISEAAVVGTAFLENQEQEGIFTHSMHFTKPLYYQNCPLTINTLSTKERDQAFADLVMKTIALHLPVQQRGVFANEELKT